MAKQVREMNYFLLYLDYYYLGVIDPTNLFFLRVTATDRRQRLPSAPLEGNCSLPKLNSQKCQSLNRSPGPQFGFGMNPLTFMVQKIASNVRDDKN